MRDHSEKEVLRFPQEELGDRVSFPSFLTSNKFISFGVTNFAPDKKTIDELRHFILLGEIAKADTIVPRYQRRKLIFYAIAGVSFIVFVSLLTRAALGGRFVTDVLEEKSAIGILASGLGLLVCFSLALKYQKKLKLIKRGTLLRGKG